MPLNETERWMRFNLHRLFADDELSKAFQSCVNEVNGTTTKKETAKLENVSAVKSVSDQIKEVKRMVNGPATTVLPSQLTSENVSSSLSGSIGASNAWNNFSTSIPLLTQSQSSTNSSGMLDTCFIITCPAEFSTYPITVGSIQIIATRWISLILWHLSSTLTHFQECHHFFQHVKECLVVSRPDCWGWRWPTPI